jgi:hypothetical protein
MMTREMTPMYVYDGGFQPPKIEGLLPYFLVLHQMMRKTPAPRIGYSEVIPAYERNLLDALMKLVHFDVFEYIVDEIWNIASNPLRSCGFAPYIQFMIESVRRRSSTRMCVMTLFALQCPRIQGLLVLVLLLLLLALPIVVVPPPLMLPTPIS